MVIFSTFYSTTYWMFSWLLLVVFLREADSGISHVHFDEVDSNFFHLVSLVLFNENYYLYLFESRIEVFLNIFVNFMPF